MEQFDDVELQILEEPEPPRGPRRATRWALAVVAAALSAGAMAAGASALSETPPPAAKHHLQALRSDAPAMPCAEHHAVAARD
jgi:hypothetical protein